MHHSAHYPLTLYLYQHSRICPQFQAKFTLLLAAIGGVLFRCDPDKVGKDIAVEIGLDAAGGV